MNEIIEKLDLRRKRARQQFLELSTVPSDAHIKKERARELGRYEAYSEFKGLDWKYEQ